MLTTNQENSKYNLTNCPKCVDTDFCTFYKNPHLSRRNYKIYYSKETHPCLATTTSLQCYITILLSTFPIWTFRISCQYFSWHGKPQHGQHIIIRLPHMATPKDYRNKKQLHHLSSIPSVPIAQLYKHMIHGNTCITPFTSPTESIADTESIWTLFSHTGVYVMAIGSFIPAWLGIFCCYFFWCWPARLVHQPLQPGSMWYTIVDEDVEAEPIYRCEGKVKQPTSPHKNHDLHMEWEPTQMESWQKQWTQSLGVPACRSLDNTSKIQGTQ